MQAGCTAAVCATEARYPSYGDTIDTCESDGLNDRTEHFDDLSLETARLYAIHLRSFMASNAGNGDPQNGQLERDLGKSYDFYLLTTLVGTWGHEEDGHPLRWRDVSSVCLTFTPAASTSTALDWNSFVVSVPGLLRGRGGGRRRMEERSAPERFADRNDFCLTVRTDESDSDNRQTRTYNNLSLVDVRLYSSILAYC